VRAARSENHRHTWTADGQNDPADIPKLLTEAAQRQDRAAASASSRAYGARRQDTLSRKLASRAANAIRQDCFTTARPIAVAGSRCSAREAFFLSLPYFDISTASSSR